MNFIDIFKEEGLYTMRETSDGVALRVKENITGTGLEMRIVMYSNPLQQNPKELQDYAINNILVNMDFVKVKDVKILFGSDRIEFFNIIKRDKNLMIQAREIVSKEGGCPQTTLGGCVCEECLFPFINGTISGCNKEKAYGIAHAFLL